MTVCHDAEGHCITCSDEGVPMQVVAVGEHGIASCVDATGEQSDVMTDLIDGVTAGEELLVHAGVALARVG